MVGQHNILFCQNILYRNCNFQYIFLHFQQRRRFTNHPNRPCKSGEKIEVNEQKCFCAFLCAEYFYFQDRHLFSCVDPLFLRYRVLNMRRVALF